MNLRLLNFLTGYVILRTSGIYSERILNIAKEEGIFIFDIEKDSDMSILFSVSQKGAKRLFSMDLPEGITLSQVSEKGLFSFFKKRRSRKMLLIAPILCVVLLLLSTQIIWNVNIIGDDSVMEARLKEELKNLGVSRGTLKVSVDQSYVKNQILINNNDLLWIWVDLKGGSAIVKYALRTLPPEVFNENDYSNIYADKDAIITRIIATDGIAKVNEGDIVVKGQLLIEGIKIISQEETVPTRASGTVYGTVWEEKTVNLPKKEEIRTPTGNQTEHLIINFVNFPIKLFINSSILYTEYDIIDYSRKIPFIPLSFDKKEYREVSVTYKENDINSLVQKETEEFKSELMQKGLYADNIESYLSDEGDSVLVSLRTLCEEPIGVERRINIGEDNFSTDN
ncbi:MAG: sporulation protein YqfD [Clostridia bacterium]